MSEELKKLPGKTKKPPWPTFSPSSCSVLWENIEIAKILNKSDNMDRAGASWRSSLMVPGMLLAHKAKPKEWLMCVYQGTCLAILWPTEEYNIGKRLAWGLKKLDSISDLRMEVVHDLHNWLTMEYTWPTPLRHFVLCGKLPMTKKSIVALQDGKAVPLLTHHARKAFVDLPTPVLGRLCKEELEIDLSSKTYAEKVHAAIKVVLKKTDAEAGSAVAFCVVFGDVGFVLCWF